MVAHFGTKGKFDLLDFLEENLDTELTMNEERLFNEENEAKEI